MLNILRGLSRIFLLVATLILYLIPHGLTRALDRPSPWPRRFLAHVTRICGAIVEMRGSPLRSDVLFVANHSSWLDIPIIAGTTGTTFVSTAEVRAWPLVGWLAALNGTIFVDRGDRLGVHGQVGAVRAALARHRPVTVFPEGTTGTALLSFKPALLEVVAPPPPGVMVQPIVLDYGAARALAWVGDEPAPANVWRVLTRPGTFRVRIDCLDPFDPALTGDRKAIAAEARRRMLAASARAPAGV